MKIKIILLLTVMLTFSYSHAFETDSLTHNLKESVVPDSVSSTFKEIYGDIKTGIVAMAQALKVGAEEVFIILVKQQVVNAITNIVFGIIGLLLILVFFKAYKNKEENWFTDDEYDEFPSGMGIIRILQLILGVVLFMILIVNINETIMGLINPSYGAIKEILEIVTKSTH